MQMNLSVTVLPKSTSVPYFEFKKKKKSVTQKQTVDLISVVEKNMDRNRVSQCSA